MAFRGVEGRVGNVERRHSDDKRLNDRQLRKCAENGVFGRGAGRGGKKRVDWGEEC